ncbi:MAG: hypothetical protein JWN78_2157 [Bacteroidota bacterium]|nr:hypothetical protein [Bacteroidota bacterium]
MRSKYLHLLFTLSLFISFSTKAQTWTTVATFNQVIDDLKSYHGNLYIGGNFYQRDGNTSYSSSFYNGSTFTDQPTLIGGTGVNRFEIYKNELYATGGITIESSIGLDLWDTTSLSWIPVGNFSSSTTGIYADGNDLYVGTDFSLVKESVNGAAFTSLPAFDGSNTSTYAITKYNGSIIVAGTDMAYSGTNLNHIAKWTGTTWQGLGTGLDGTVRCLAVYNNELYAGGYFTHAGGVAAQYIAKWNGTAWTAVGGSVTTSGGNGLRDMVVYNGKLYVVGDFTVIGGVTTKYVAVWNGTSWTSLNLSPSTSFANTIEVYNGKLYVGTFNFTAAKLYVLDPLTAVQKNIANENFSFFPNPASGVLFASYTGKKMTDQLDAIIYDMAGRSVLHQLVRGEQFAFDISHLNTGIYFIEIRDGEKNILVSNKFVKE